MPEGLEFDFDYELLLQLVCSSFSCNYNLQVNSENVIELLITVYSNGVRVQKKLSELFSFQVLKLFKIYLNERISVCYLMASDDSEKELIKQEEEKKIQRFNEYVASIEEYYENNDFFKGLL